MGIYMLYRNMESVLWLDTIFNAHYTVGIRIMLFLSTYQKNKAILSAIGMPWVGVGALLSEAYQKYYLWWWRYVDIMKHIISYMRVYSCPKAINI